MDKIKSYSFSVRSASYCITFTHYITYCLQITKIQTKGKIIISDNMLLVKFGRFSLCSNHTM